ncbi:hypothetical protein GOBAR_AA18861 [Gossypium barbadense]|uniref:Cellulose synthase-like protein G3 n=1 Tax=Gossypium barbadense TaxID=3634 RepID=A0A2P5XER4_GOSBA|nr:hypothetical protein GOBAR_AA18861 [Gossypium barbadense]
MEEPCLRDLHRRPCSSAPSHAQAFTMDGPKPCVCGSLHLCLRCFVLLPCSDTSPSETLVSFSLTLSLFISENIEKFLEPRSADEGGEYSVICDGVRVSDNGGSALTLFAFMEAAKFAAYWLPFCRKNGITTRSPDEYFASNCSRTIEPGKIRKENVVETGRVYDEYITNDKVHQAFSKWSTDHGFTCQNHPSDSGFVGEKPRQRHYRPLFAKPDPEIRNRLAYIHFPQEFHGLNETDSYAGRLIRLFKLNPSGLDGLSGPNYMGTCCFIRQRSLFGDPSTLVSPEIRELSPDYVVDNPITSPSVLEVAHRNKRWQIGLLEVASSRYSPITFGVKAMGLFMGLGYSSYAYSSILSIPITTYSFVPQLALLNGLNIFPNVSEPWFLLYVFLFLGAYGQDFLEHCVGGGTIQRWCSDQRMWMIKGLSCFLFGLTEFLLKSIGIPTQGFNVTRKAIDDEQRKRYEQGLFEFGQQGNGVNAIVVISFNYLPIYEAMVLRSDKGKMPIRISFTATTLVLAVN